MRVQHQIMRMQVVEVMSLVSTLAYIQGAIVAIKHTIGKLMKRALLRVESSS